MKEAKCIFSSTNNLFPSDPFTFLCLVPGMVIHNEQYAGLCFEGVHGLIVETVQETGN